MNKADQLNNKEIMQINATIIAGSLIFLGFLFDNPSDRNALVAGFTAGGVILIFSWSALFALHGAAKAASSATFVGFSFLTGMAITWIVLGLKVL